ncbi:MAG: biotin--[acetyl-CoA-carboxylase] ligase [Cyclobacteriaceae bacterium]
MFKINTNTELIGNNIIYLPKCHSTNDIASELLKKENLAEGSLIITDHQLAGRGQRGNQWLTEASQNLTFSVILKPDFLDISHSFYLNIFVSLAIRDYLGTIIGNYVKIKWPNDIYYQNSKICGILIENFLKGQFISQTILGIGLNVNQNYFSISNATSLYQITNQIYNLEHALVYLLEFLEKRYFQLKALKFDQLKQDYYRHFYWMGEEHTFKADKEFVGIIKGINKTGHLIIDTGEGIKSYDLKEIVFIK